MAFHGSTEHHQLGCAEPVPTAQQQSSPDWPRIVLITFSHWSRFAAESQLVNMSSFCSQWVSRFNSSWKKEHRTNHPAHRELTFRWKQVSHHKTNGSGNCSKSVQLRNTIVHFSSQNRHPSWGPWDMGDRHCEHEIADPFALVWHTAHTPAGPVFALRSPRGFLTQPLEQCVSEDWPLPHWGQAVHIAWRSALFKQVASQEIFCRSLKRRSWQSLWWTPFISNNASAQCRFLSASSRTATLPRFRWRWLCHPLMRFTRERSGLFPTLRSTKFPPVSWGKWSSCRSVPIGGRLLVHQLLLLMFDRHALLTHLRLQLLQPLEVSCSADPFWKRWPACAPLRNFSWSRVLQQQQSWPWTDGLDRDDHERPIRPVLCCTDGAVRKQPYHPKEPPGRTRRCAESVPAVQVFPLQLVTLDLSLSPASLQLVNLKLSLMPASLTSRSTRAISALPSSEYITQGSMTICSHSPHLSKNPSLQWNCCGTCSASPLPLPHPTTPSLRMADTRVGRSMVPKDPRKCEEFRCSCNSIKLKAWFTHSLMRVKSMSRQNYLQDNLRRFWETKTTVDTARILKYQQLSKQLNCWRSFRVRTLHVFGHRTKIQFVVLKQHTPPLPISFSRVQFTWYCCCEMCKCCEMCCSKRQNEDTMREAEHVQAHTVEITLAPQQGRLSRWMYRKRSPWKWFRGHTKNGSTPWVK